MHKTGPLKQMVKPRRCDGGLKVREAAERCRSSSTPGWGLHKCWPGKRPPLCAPCGNLLSQGSQLGKAQIWPNRHWPKDVKAFWNFALQEDKLVELKNNNNNKSAFCLCRKPQGASPKTSLLLTPPGHRLNIQDKRKTKSPNTICREAQALRSTACSRHHGVCLAPLSWLHNSYLHLVSKKKQNCCRCPFCCKSTWEADLMLKTKDVQPPRRSSSLSCWHTPCYRSRGVRAPCPGKQHLPSCFTQGNPAKGGKGIAWGCPAS